MQTGVDDPILRVTGKSKQWIIGLFCLFLDIVFIIMFVLSFFYDPIWFFMIICPTLIILSLYLMMFTIGHDIKATVTYNPNDKTITVENVRNPIFRLICCKSKELAQTYAINRISNISNIKGCCFYKFSVVSLGQSIVQTDDFFGQSELSPIIEVVKPTIDAARLLEAQQRAAAIAPPPQQIIIVVQNAEEYLRANPNAQVQIVQQGNYNPTSILPIQQQQPIMQFPNQQGTISYPTTVPEYSQVATKQ